MLQYLMVLDMKQFDKAIKDFKCILQNCAEK